MGWSDEQAARQRRKLQNFVRRLREQPCTDCMGEYPWYVMEFDHCRGVKDTDIAKMVHKPVGMERLRREIAKCDLVCANCHRARTYARLGYAEIAS